MGLRDFDADLPSPVSNPVKIGHEEERGPLPNEDKRARSRDLVSSEGRLEGSTVCAAATCI